MPKAMNRPPVIINTPEDAYAVTKAWHNRRQEHLLVITLSANNFLIKKHCVAKGSVRSVALAAREYFYPAIRDNASYIIVCHNHPDGLCEPTPQDLIAAERTQMQGEILGIRVWDEMILTKHAFFSMKKDGPPKYRLANQYGYGMYDMRKFMGDINEKNS